MNWENEEEGTINCYHCDAEIWDEAEQCPECGQYLLDEDATIAARPNWIALTTIVLLVAMLLPFALPLFQMLFGAQ